MIRPSVAGSDTALAGSLPGWLHASSPQGTLTWDHRASDSASEIS